MDECDRAETLLSSVSPSQISKDCLYNSLCAVFTLLLRLVTCYEAIGDTKRMNRMNSHRHRSLPPKEGLLYLLSFWVST